MNHNETNVSDAELTLTDTPPLAEAPVAEPAEEVDADYLREAEALREVYPDFDLAVELADPILGEILRGRGKPTLRQLYEAAHMDRIVEGRVEAAVTSAVANAVETAVTAAVADAVRKTEEQVLEHIRARGRRPVENGTRAASGVRMHPAVNRLSRRDRALLAKRAELGETIKL